MNAVRSIISKLNGTDDSQLASSSSSSRPSSVLRPPDAAAKKLFEVMQPIVVSTKSLDFGPLSQGHVELEITLTNPNRSEYPPVAWKALTNLQFCYCVRPNMGTLKSGESVVVTLIRETATRLTAKDGLTRRPAFLFKSTPILEEWYDGDRHTLWQHLPSLSDHLTFMQVKVTGNPPGDSIPLISPSAAASPISAGGSGAGSPGASEAVGDTTPLAMSPEDMAAEITRLRAENHLLRMTVQSMSALALLPHPPNAPGGVISNISRAYPAAGAHASTSSSPTTPSPLASPSSPPMSSRGPPATLFPLTLPTGTAPLSSYANGASPSRSNASGSSRTPRPLSASDMDFEDAAPTYEEAIAQSAMRFS